MSQSKHRKGDADAQPRFSRTEIETLCTLYSLADGCTMPVLTQRLGLPTQLVAVVTEAVAGLVAIGDVVMDDEFVELSAAGRARLDDALVCIEVERDGKSSSASSLSASNRAGRDGTAA